MKILLTMALLAVSAIPASACDVFGLFRCCGGRRVQTQCVQPTCYPQHQTVYFTPNINQASYVVPTHHQPVIVQYSTQCPDGRCRPVILGR